MRDPQAQSDGSGTRGAGLDWHVDYGAHPLLDPEFTRRPSRLLRFAQLTRERIRDDDAAYCRETARLLRPLRETPGQGDGCPDDITALAEFLQEADNYLNAAIGLLPQAGAREHARPLPEVAGAGDLRGLLELAFDHDELRGRFEALRKIYLAKLLVDINQSHHVQEGPRHLAYFEELLQETLWRHTRQVDELIVGFGMNEDGETIRYTSRPQDEDSRCHFQSIFLEKTTDRRKISVDILYYSCRFKRSVDHLSYEIVDGRHRVLERQRWGEMRYHTSGSILSKMVRKGINDPEEIADLLGAMFIVHDEDAVNDLLTLLDAGIGNPLGWRNVTDTIGGDANGLPLNRHSGHGYKVFKGDVDILVPARGDGRPPYRFSVEIQIHTLEGYLRTICGEHQASHAALKLRQFLHGLVPVIFPAPIYGTDWLTLE